MNFTEWEELGRMWLSGQYNIAGLNNFKLNQKQKEFVNDKHRFSLASGGFASGKTSAFLVKLFFLNMMFPNSHTLLGRRTRADVEKNILPDLWSFIPPKMVRYKVREGIIEFPNNSKIFIYGLDTLASGEDDLKKSEQKIKGLNLNFVFIDQLEEIEEKVFVALNGRLRRPGQFHQMVLTTNPANYWAYDWFIKEPKPGTNVVQMSMLDNKENLPQDFLESQLKMPEHYVKRYVYGDWDITTIYRNNVFDPKLLDAQKIRQPIKAYDGIRIYKEARPDQKYFIGVDPSTGSADDPYFIAVASEEGEIVACASGYEPVNQQVDKTLHLTKLYNKPPVIPEANGVGVSFIDTLKRFYTKIFEREVYVARYRRKTNKLGWTMSYSSKAQLIEHTKDLILKGTLRLNDHEIIQQFRIFVYTDVARKQGAGAPPGYHDDAVIATMLALWPVSPYGFGERRMGFGGSRFGVDAVDLLESYQPTSFL